MNQNIERMNALFTMGRKEEENLFIVKKRTFYQAKPRRIHEKPINMDSKLGTSEHLQAAKIEEEEMEPKDTNSSGINMEGKENYLSKKRGVESLRVEEETREMFEGERPMREIEELKQGRKINIPYNAMWSIQEKELITIPPYKLYRSIAENNKRIEDDWQSLRESANQQLDPNDLFQYIPGVVPEPSYNDHQIHKKLQNAQNIVDRYKRQKLEKAEEERKVKEMEEKKSADAVERERIIEEQRRRLEEGKTRLEEEKRRLEEEKRRLEEEKKAEERKEVEEKKVMEEEKKVMEYKKTEESNPIRKYLDFQRYLREHCTEHRLLRTTPFNIIFNQLTGENIEPSARKILQEINKYIADKDSYLVTMDKLVCKRLIGQIKAMANSPNISSAMLNLLHLVMRLGDSIPHIYELLLGAIQRAHLPIQGLPLPPKDPQETTPHYIQYKLKTKYNQETTYEIYANHLTTYLVFLSLLGNNLPHFFISMLRALIVKTMNRPIDWTTPQVLYHIQHSALQSLHGFYAREYAMILQHQRALILPRLIDYCDNMPINAHGESIMKDLMISHIILLKTLLGV